MMNPNTQPIIKRRREIKAVIRGLQMLSRLSGKSPEKILAPLTNSIVGADVMAEITDEIRSAVGLPPQITFIGKTGVGKSSTLNELFDPQPNLPVDHVEPATFFIEIRELSLGERGKLIFVDCPGLGDSASADKRNISAYKDILGKSDVAVWILKADDRTLGIDQSFIKQVLPKSLKEKLIVAINQVDKIEPGEWIREANLPSDEQLISIRRKEDVVRAKFMEIGIKPFSVVSYSAKKHYRLKRLFKLMVDACPQERIPVLVNSQGEIKSFLSDEQNELQEDR